MHGIKEEIKQNQRELFIRIIIDSLALIFIGLGLYAVFGANGNAFLDILNNKSVAYGLIAVSGVVTAWCHLKRWPQLRVSPRQRAACRPRATSIALMAQSQHGHPATVRRADGLISCSPAKGKRPRQSAQIVLAINHRRQ